MNQGGGQGMVQYPDLCVADCVDYTGQWNMELISQVVPAPVRDRISGLHPPNPQNREDCVAWSHTNDGEFSVSSAYDVLAKQVLLPIDILARCIWDWNGPYRINLFLWRVVSDGLPTNYQ